MSADRFMLSVTSWLERKLFLKVSATKTKVVRPSNNNFLGFTFWKGGFKLQCKPSKDGKARFYKKTKEILRRNYAILKLLSVTFKRINRYVMRLINYFRIENMKSFIDGFSQ